MKKLIVLIYIAAATILFGYAKAEVVITSSSVPSFTAQPVKKIFEQLSVKIVDNKAEISWNTSNEHNNKQFEIQRSSSNESFKTIAIFFTLEDSFKTKEYKFKDELKGVEGGKLSYRIKQVGLNDQSIYSKVIVVNL